jgi:hypothetical protein
MITESSTLVDVCFEVSTALDSHGMPAVLTGGSAATVYAPEVYTSHDADYILESDHRIDEVALALVDLGLKRHGKLRRFIHSTTQYRIYFPRGPLAVGGDYIRESSMLNRENLSLRILTRTDCIRDRLAHFYHWDDYTALNVAVEVSCADLNDVNFSCIKDWTLRKSPLFLMKFEEFEKRVQAKIRNKPTGPSRTIISS